METVVGYDFFQFSERDGVRLWAVVEQGPGRWARRVMGLFGDRGRAESFAALLRWRLAAGRELPVVLVRDEPRRRGRPQGRRV